METFKQHYRKTLNAWISECEAKAKTYAADFREDEANLEKIKLNVYDIFLRMFNLSSSKSDTDEAFKAMYLGFHRNIPKNWHTARDRAKKNDSIDYYIEDIKIGTAKKIEAFFLEAWDTHGQS